MSFAHLTLPTQYVEGTASFLERVLGYGRNESPSNSPVPTVWLNLGRDQEVHVTYVEGFETSAFEGEFGRHVALFHPSASFAELKRRVVENGGEVMEPLRASVRERFFFREPVNGYVFEIIGHETSSESD